MVSFRELLNAVEPLKARGDDTVLVAGIAYDSRRVRPGDLFVAIRGVRQDGHEYVADAVRRGAAAVLVEERSGDPGVPYGVVTSGRLALAHAAAAFHGYPSRQLRVVGVTGTDGKTTTTYLTGAALRAAGFRVGIVSTVDVRVGDESWRNGTSHTTPQAPELQALLAEMVAAGVEYAVIEVSSHALALDRVAGIDFDVAVFTNLTPEHLDFHGTFDQYRRAKARLFESLGHGRDKGAPRAGIVNADDPSFAYLADACPAPTLTYGLERPADVSAGDIRLEADGSRFAVCGPFGEVELRTQLVGRFNVYNWLAALSVAYTQGADLRALAKGAAKIEPVPGRLQRIDAGQPFGVVVDFAHTPNALAQALATLRPLTPRRLIVVFGHAGGRDAHNRRPMGEIAGRNADLTILTTDDPYDEPPEAIIAEIAQGLEQVGQRDGIGYHRIVDRREAIARALALAEPGDTVLLAGRGHEQHTTIRGERVHLDDAEEARRCLSARYPDAKAA